MDWACRRTALPVQPVRTPPYPVAIRIEVLNDKAQHGGGNIMRPWAGSNDGVWGGQDEFMLEDPWEEQEAGIFQGSNS